MPIALGGAAMVGAMYGLVSANLLAVNFTTMDSTAAIYTNYLEAQQAAGFMAPGTSTAGGQVAAELGIKTLNLVGLCVIKQQSTPFAMSMVLTAGMPVPDPTGGNAFDTSTPPPSPYGSSAAAGTVSAKINGAGQVLNPTTDPDIVHGDYGYLNSQLLTAYGFQVAGLDLGITADQVNGPSYAGIGNWPTGSGGRTPTAGDFGIYAGQLNLSGTAANTYGLNLQGSISLPNLRIRVRPGALTQADCS
ncbi:MAG: DUF6230 family protein [Nocardioides sp.]